jgi:hypothetical protein
MDRSELYRLEIERLEALLYRADAVIFDTCLCAAGCLPAKETPNQLSDWAQLSVERYLAVNPQCRPRRVMLQAIG